MTATQIDTEAVRGIVARVEEVWAANDADGFADVFTADGSLVLPGDVYVAGREQIRGYFRMGYAGPMKGSRVIGKPVDVKPVTEDVVVAITEGGVVYAGQAELADENKIRATWVVVRQSDGAWKVTAYQNSRIHLPTA